MTETSTTTTAEIPITTTNDNIDPPALTLICQFLAGLEMIGGLLLCMMLWPHVVSGYLFVNGKIIGEATATAYVPALTWLCAALISGVLLWALGDVLRYLRDIHRSFEAGRK